jgi:hypothetical protein
MRAHVRPDWLLAVLAAAGAAACTTGHEPNGCGSDLRISVAGGAEIELEWNEGCAGASGTPYRERDALAADPGSIPD